MSTRVALLTMQAARGLAGTDSLELMHKSLTASAGTATDTLFDVFLSHCIKDARAIEGIRRILSMAGLRVYVDWIDDPALNRARVTTGTAARLRERLNHSACLIFATSDASPSSVWMPWELGYFDGSRENRVAVLPIVASAGQAFRGQEYLGLYPKVENLGTDLAPKLGFKLRTGVLMDIPAFIERGAFLPTRP